MAKIQKIAQTITPFAGVSFINEEFHRCGLGELIDKELGIRTLTGYQYSEIINTWFNLFFCGGEVAEDIQQHLRPTLENIPGNKVPSADTLLRGIRELAVRNTEVESSTGNKYQFNINEKLNDLNIKSLILTGELRKGEYYDFDYDNQIIEHDKYDAKYTYKHTKGYFPGNATIGEKIVYIENRDGNANVKTGQCETLTRAYNALKSNGIYVDRSRMDAGSYSKEIIEVVDKNSRLFYIRANRCESLTAQILQITDWQDVEINFKNYQVASIPFTAFFAEKNYRLVVMREKSGNPQLNLFTGDNMIYRCILSNDHESTEQQVIEYYNQRGCGEKNFDVMNNDFGWNHLPCSDMNYNTVYLILTAMLKNFYNYIVKKVAAVFPDIRPNSRLKRFIFRFITVPGKWIRQGRQYILKLFTDRPYERLNIT